MGWQDGTPITDATPQAQPAWMSGTPIAAEAPVKGKGLLTRAWEAYRAPAEVAATLGTGALGAVAGGGAGILQGLFGGKYGTPEGVLEAKGTAGRVAQMLTYQPRGEPAQDALRTIGGLLDKSKLAGLGPTEALAVGAMPVGQALGQTAGAIRKPVQAAKNTVGEMLQRSEPQMAGVGAAETAPEALRRARAADLPVPVKLSKGEATRDFEAQRFERETAKEGSPAGAMLRAHGAEENKSVIKNMEWFMDDTGAVAPSARAAGNVVDDALRSRSNFMKGKYKDAYGRAKASGETAELVDTTPLLQYLGQNTASKGTAKILQVAEDEAVRLGGATRAKEGGGLFPAQMSINDIEQMRKRVVRDGQATPSDAHYAGEINKVIDAMTEGKGGKLYAEARQLYKDHAAEFKNQGAIKKLLSTKPGTTDRSVAFEDVFKHSVLGGSMDDTAAIFRSLGEGGAKGKQAIAELKGATIKYLQDQASKNAARDINGNPILSYSKLNNAVKELEIDGKLEFMFGKKGAQQIRDITEIVADLNVAPPGAVNSSTTSSVLMEALGAAMTGRLPTATAKTVQGIRSAMGDYKNIKRVREALAQPDTVH